jgi:hypothetical protein
MIHIYDANQETKDSHAFKKCYNYKLREMLKQRHILIPFSFFLLDCIYFANHKKHYILL